MIRQDNKTFASAPGFGLLVISLLSLLLLVLVSCSSENGASLHIGDAAPPFTVQDLDGRTISLADFAGSPVILRFFLTDCKFCRADTPILEDYYKRYAEKGLRVLYIDPLGVEPARLKKFAEQFGITFPVTMDIGGKVAARYKARALPQTIVLDPQHKIIAAILGGISEPELNAQLAPYLK